MKPSRNIGSCVETDFVEFVRIQLKIVVIDPRRCLRSRNIRNINVQFFVFDTESTGSVFELRQNKRIGITGREVAVKDHIVGYHIGFLEDNLKHGVFLRQNYAVDFQFVTDGIFARLNQFTFFVHRRCRVVLDFVGHVFTILVGSGDSGHEIEDIAGIGCHLRLDAFNFRFECFPFFAGEKGEKNH